MGLPKCGDPKKIYLVRETSVLSYCNARVQFRRKGLYIEVRQTGGVCRRKDPYRGGPKRVRARYGLLLLIFPCGNVCVCGVRCMSTCICVHDAALEHAMQASQP